MASKNVKQSHIVTLLLNKNRSVCIKGFRRSLKVMCPIWNVIASIRCAVCIPTICSKLNVHMIGFCKVAVLTRGSAHPDRLFCRRASEYPTADLHILDVEFRRLVQSVVWSSYFFFLPPHPWSNGVFHGRNGIGTRWHTGCSQKACAWDRPCRLPQSN